MRRNFKDYGSLFIFLFWILSNNVLLPNSSDYHKKECRKEESFNNGNLFDVKLRGWDKFGG